MNKLFIITMAFLLIFSLNAQNAEEIKVRLEMESIIAEIDSNGIGGKLQNREFVVTLFQQILGKSPTALELENAIYMLERADRDKHSCHTVQLKRSQILAALLARKENTSTLSMKIIERNLPLLRQLNLDTPPTMQLNEEAKWRESDLPAYGLSLHTNDGQYNLYYGYLHSHTGYSDGEGTPEEAYTMARDIAKIDFFSVTDHSEMISIWPWDDKWKKIKNVAAQFHKDHQFVALHGFEWSSPIYGHINVLYCDDITNSISNFRPKDLFEWVNKRPQAIVRFNHPGRDPLGIEFDHFKLRANMVRQMVGVEMYNKNKGVKHYLDTKGYDGEYRYIDEANRKGWKLGAVGGQDNHNKDWGTRNDFIVGVWAEELTRESIVEGYRQRRTFASEDRNMSLSFKMEGAQMGSRLTTGEKNVLIQLSDGNREGFTKAILYKSGMPVQTFDLKNAKSPEVNHKVTTADGEYYYVVAIQEDGDVAISSPIWIMAQ